MLSILRTTVVSHGGKSADTPANARAPPFASSQDWRCTSSFGVVTSTGFPLNLGLPTVASRIRLLPPLRRAILSSSCLARPSIAAPPLAWPRARRGIFLPLHSETGLPLVSPQDGRYLHLGEEPTLSRDVRSVRSRARIPAARMLFYTKAEGNLLYGELSLSNLWVRASVRVCP